MIIEKWEKLPRKQKSCVFIGLGVVALLCIIAGSVARSGTGDESSAQDNSRSFDSCSDYKSLQDLSVNFTYEGVHCGSCLKIGKDDLFFSDCDNSCSQWVLNPKKSDFDPLFASCEIVSPPTTSPPGSDFVCPIGFYKTHHNSGCVAKTVDDFQSLFAECVHLDENATLEECYKTCEDLDDNCFGVLVTEDGSDCVVLESGAKKFCGVEYEGTTICERIPPDFECFDGPLGYSDAEKDCVEVRGLTFATLPNPDEFNIQFTRIANACHSPTGCFFGSGAPECFFVDSNGKLDQDPECDKSRGYCCETPKSAPTTAPTVSPTAELFFVPDCNFDGKPDEVNFTQAHECCLEYGADLASIHSQEEQDFAWEVCLTQLLAFKNDCGCWNGLNRIGIPPTINPNAFFWTDGSDTSFKNFETAPLLQPNNLDNRNEACVHMRPFTAGGWNDLPCSGECDAKDTKPFPLCRKRTDAPTSSPTFNPTAGPTKNPTTSPTNLPTTSPTYSPTKYPTYSPSSSPTKSPTTSPTKKPTTSPTKNPTKSPTNSPTLSPTKYPTASPSTSPTKNPSKAPTSSPSKSPTRSPTYSPTTSPTKNPTQFPTQSPTASPTKSPTTSPTNSPTDSPTISPTRNPTTSPSTTPTTSPTDSPTTSPTKSPTKNPTYSPTHSPTASPTKSPTQNPTYSPTKNPTAFPTDSPTRNPTYSPTTFPTHSPTSNPTNSPTNHPTYSPTKNPTLSPTNSPTKFPTISPTKNPTKEPTTSPTQNPTDSPTRSPTPPPVIVYPECHYGTDEWIWYVQNFDNDLMILRYYFFNPLGHALLHGVPGLYPDCIFGICVSNVFHIQPGQKFEFSSPVPTIYVEFQCNFGNADVCSETYTAPIDLIECVCPLFEFFEDDFESYPVKNGLTPADSPAFFQKWNVFPGTIDIKGLLKDSNGNLILDSNGQPIPSANFFTNPCIGTGCVDIDGTVQFEPEINTLASRDIEIPPSDAFYNRICSMNFFVRGNGRCGDLHKQKYGIQNPGQAKTIGCLQLYANNLVPLFDNLTVALYEETTTLLQVLFQDIPWDQKFLPYGLTADVSNLASNVSGSFTVKAGKLAPEEGGGNIGPILDDVDMTCCCPDDAARYIGRVVEVMQGLTFNGSLVPAFKSDYGQVIGREPAYSDVRVFSLGLGGSITFEFNLGATGYIKLFEQSYICCCCDDHDPEDAKVEVSIDGITWFIVKTSFKKSDWHILPGGDGSIRYAYVWLPNGACFKYVRVTDQSDPDCVAADGFDLISVIVEEPCCPTIRPAFPTKAPTELGQQSELSVGASGGATAAFVIAGLVIVTMAMLGMLTLLQSRRQQLTHHDPGEILKVSKRAGLDANAPMQSRASMEMDEQLIQKEL